MSALLAMHDAVPSTRMNHVRNGMQRHRGAAARWGIALVALALASACGSNPPPSVAVGAAGPSPSVAVATASAPPIGAALTPVRIDGTAMLPTLVDQELVAVDGSAYAKGSPARGDIVLIAVPNGGGMQVVKRVIGLPGDVIEVDGSQNPTAVLIKPGGTGPWRMLHEGYLPQLWTTLNNCCGPDGKASASGEPYTLPKGEYFVMGDNRNFSSDSRSFGPVPAPDLLGKVVYQLGGAGNFYAGGPTLVPA